MGFYLNNKAVYSLYKSEASKPYFVDKTMILQELFPLIEEGKSYLCITRPRRFGKTVMANLIGSFLVKDIDASEVFDRMKIAEYPEYKTHLNQHNVIYIDFSKMDDSCSSYQDYISNIKELLREDLHGAYPQCQFREKGTVAEDLMRIHQKTEEKFVFVLDEWDGEKYTGRYVCKTVIYVLRDVPQYGLQDGYCIIGMI